MTGVLTCIILEGIDFLLQNKSTTWSIIDPFNNIGSKNLTEIINQYWLKNLHG